ncbi:MAG: DNA helicase, partial [Candidatus Parabeggiatoa sp. nov. 1]
MLKLTAKHKIIRAYYKELSDFNQLGKTHEGTVKIAFQHLLESCAKQCQWLLVQEETLKRSPNKWIRLDGVLFDSSHLVRGYWEAKDSQDDLPVEVQKKLYQDNYPNDNIIFQAPQRAILIQNGRNILDLSLDEPAHLVRIVEQFFNFKLPEYERWDLAAVEFKERVPDLAQQLLALIQKAYLDDKAFATAFNHFANQCRQAINPNLADAALEEMLIQHLLTERIFRNIFKHPDFAKRNIIAREIETVIEKLTAHVFNRDAFFESLKYFYKALEEVAASIDEYNYKQHFLNTVYERFFQGFSVKTADTHGIVYTPQPIVEFMVNSVQEILQQEFGKTLASKGVHFLDPFVGTGNFIVRVMQELAATSRLDLDYKYQHELHCNEIMLLPYYIACMNIEHEYVNLMGKYRPFEGICLADTFELAEDKQMDLFAPENTERVKKQQETAFFVIIGNPPYNAGQANENDNNKNRKYQTIDERVRETYAKASKATNRNALADPYVKAIRQATDRIENEGIVAFVTNNGFLDNIAFEGMRQHLAQDFSKMYILDLGGNIRKNPGKTSNVFDIKVGVSINFLVKSRSQKKAIFYAHIGDTLNKAEKLASLDSQKHVGNVNWKPIFPNKNDVWLTEGLHSEFEDFTPLGTKEAKAEPNSVEGVIFRIYSRGAETTRDAWVYNFNQQVLSKNVRRLIKTYNQELKRWHNDKNVKLDDFVLNDDTQIKWSSRLKECLLSGQQATFAQRKISHSFYRPFCVQFLFFDEILTHRQGQLPRIFPTPNTETENQVICVSDKGSEKPFMVLVSQQFVDLHLVGAGSSTQCFPFYTYF